MTREEAIQILADLIDNPFLHTWEEQNKALHMAIEALSEPINCVKCKHYYETEDDMDVHGHCKMDTAHTYLISKEEAIEMLKALNMMLRNPDGEPISDVCEAIDMAIEALSIDVVSREEYEEVKAYMDTLVDAFIEDGKELTKSIKVVRCNECKWYQGVHGVQGQAPCEWFNQQVLWNDFCSNGEPYKGGDAK